MQNHVSKVGQKLLEQDMAVGNIFGLGCLKFSA